VTGMFSSVVRVRKWSNKIVGAGFLVEKQQVLNFVTRDFSSMGRHTSR